MPTLAAGGTLSSSGTSMALKTVCRGQPGSRTCVYVVLGTTRHEPPEAVAPPPEAAGSINTARRRRRNVAHAKRRHRVVRRVRPRARPASVGRALKLSGCETTAGIDCDALVAAKLP
eukprot:3032118-Prymnesium_polylepis.1